MRMEMSACEDKDQEKKLLAQLKNVFFTADPSPQQQAFGEVTLHLHFLNFPSFDRS